MSALEKFLSVFEHRLPDNDAELQIGGVDEEFGKTASPSPDPTAIFEENLLRKKAGLSPLAMPVFQSRAEKAFAKCVTSVEKLFEGHDEELAEALAIVKDARTEARASASKMVGARSVRTIQKTDVSAQFSDIVEVDSQNMNEIF